MDFTTAVNTCFQKYVVWQGRASRSEFWFFALFSFIVDVFAAVIDAALKADSVLYLLTVMGLFLPTLAVTVRRLHDTNRSGWWYWLALVPVAGIIILIIWFCERGTAGGNDYGDDPLPENAEPMVRTARTSDLDRLERLTDLHGKGVLTDAEYERQKAAILR